MNKTRSSFSGPIEDRLPFEMRPVVLNMHSTGTDDELIARYT